MTPPQTSSYMRKLALSVFIMRRFAKTFGWLAVLAMGFGSAQGFSLLGPLPAQTPGADQWQDPIIGWALAYFTDIGTPKNLGEEYRRNTPVMYYACDANFLDYFGSNGVAAVDGAFAIFNGLTNVSTYSDDLSEFPDDSRQVNYEAQFLGLLDLRTETMRLIIENLGLAQPERYTWGIHTRFLPPGTTCPFGEEYLIVQRNFDPVLGTPSSQLISSPYVNDTLYTYQIIEVCTGPNPLAVAEPFPVDPTAHIFTSVAGSDGDVAFPNMGFVNFITPFGAYLTSLTRDDVGGLRYLLSTNTVNFESSGPNTLVQSTNTTAQLLFTSNLTLFAAQALTNTDAALQALYPGLLLAAPATNIFTVLRVTNLTAYFTNFPWDPALTFPHLVLATNVTLVPQTLFVHFYANLEVVTFTNGVWNAALVNDITGLIRPNFMTVQTASVTSPPYGIAGFSTLVTNFSTRTILTNEVSGEFVLLPTNVCGLAIFYPLITNVVSSTNTIVATNAGGIINTNPIGATNVSGQSFSQNFITSATNHVFVSDQIICTSSNTALYQGVERLTFIRRDFDSLLGQLFYPVTNTYILNSITNNAIVPQTVQRIVTYPDFLFTAQDLAGGPGAPPIPPMEARGINFNPNNRGTNLAGPGTIEPAAVGPSTIFVFNKVGPDFVNLGLTDTNAFLTQLSQTALAVWGSFDGTTNPPIVYPNGASIADLENQLLIQITPRNLPPGALGLSYSVQMQSQGQTADWQAPYAWSLAPGSAGLPPGLSLSSSGLISGIPTQSDDFDFTIEVTDADGRTLDRSFDINIP